VFGVNKEFKMKEKKFKKKIGNYEIVVTYRNNNIAVVIPRAVYCTALGKNFRVEKRGSRFKITAQVFCLPEILDLIEEAAQVAASLDEYRDLWVRKMMKTRGFEEA